jgi:hypothetical protein
MISGLRNCAMSSIFISYSRQDYFFAEMLAIKLHAEGFTVWRDLGSIRAGDDWRESIENGIKESVAVVVALSSSSAESPYLTYEWAYALGLSKTVIPVLLSDCTVHPRLKYRQHVDFSYPKSLPWPELIHRLREVEEETDAGPTPPGPAIPGFDDEAINQAVGKILSYLDQRGYTRASFDRLRQKIDPDLTDEKFNAIIARKPELFRRTTIKGPPPNPPKPGIAKRVP